MSDFETTQRKRNITVGIFTLLAVSALVWLIYKFEDLPIRVGKLHSFQVFVRFSTAAGVQEKTPVRFCGYQIGRVAKVKAPEILEDLNTGKFYHQTLVILSIDNDYDNVPANVEPKLMTRGFGSSYIEFRARPIDPNKPLVEFLRSGSLLQGSTGMTSEFFPEETQQKLEDMVANFKELIENANDILGKEENKENLSATLANLTEATEQSKKSLQRFEDFMASATETSSQLNQTLTEMQAILEKINAGQGTAGKFVNDGRLYENLLENSQQLEILLEELKMFVAELPDKGVPIKLK